MHFASYEFILFLFVLVVVYYAIPKKWQWMLLLAASYVFYSFAGIGNFAYILTTTVTTWFAAIKITQLKKHQTDHLARNKSEMSREERKTYKAEIKAKQRKWLIVCLVLNFGILAVLKYSGYFSIGSLGLVMSLGISFYTFQAMGYLIDIYRGIYDAEKNLAKMALFISFFPQLIQGPISRFNQLKETLFAEHTFDSQKFSYGLMRILWGFFKKLVIADRLFAAVSTMISSPSEYQGAYVLVIMFFYAIELYADFTGGIDIAIGAAQLLGIRLEENFERPYFSKSITEYWRRWHITLGTWFKDYLFYPISVSKTMLNLSKKARKTIGNGIGKRLPIYIASILVWFTTGIWHGSSWNFIVWGLMNCLVILVSQECAPLYEKFHKRFSVGHTGWYRLFQVVRTFWLMSFIRTLDLYPQVSTTFRLYASIFTRWNLPELFQGGLMQIGLTGADYVVLAAAVGLVLYESLQSRSSESLMEKVSSRPLMARYAAYFMIFVVILVFGAYGIGYDSNQFIYSRF